MTDGPGSGLHGRSLIRHGSPADIATVGGAGDRDPPADVMRAPGSPGALIHPASADRQGASLLPPVLAFAVANVVDVSGLNLGPNMYFTPE